MENNVLNIDFENMSEDQLVLIEKKSKEYRKKTLDRRVAELEDWKKKEESKVALLEQSNKKLEISNKDLMAKVGEMSKETDKITKTFLTDGASSWYVTNIIHKLVYIELKENSVKDKLFHGTLTRKCKAHIKKQFQVSAWCWIKSKDKFEAEKLARKFLNKTVIHSIIQNEATGLDEFYKKCDRNPNTKLSDKKISDRVLLELLIDECGGDLYAI